MPDSSSFRIGIIGAENSHAAAFARSLNVANVAPGFRVTHLWGETAEFAAKTAEAGRIPNIVADPLDMRGHIDGVIVDHRDGRHHLAAALPFVEAGLPVFVDKPFSPSTREARAFLQRRRERGVAVTTMSTMPHQASVGILREALAALGPLSAVHLNGPGDPHSPYGGIDFYAIHQVELMVALFGTDAQRVWAAYNDKTFTALIHYPDGLTVTLGMPGVRPFTVTAIGPGGAVHRELATDEDTYRTGLEMVIAMFRTGVEPFDDVHMFAPVAILEALRASATQGRPVAVEPLHAKSP